MQSLNANKSHLTLHYIDAVVMKNLLAPILTVLSINSTKVLLNVSFKTTNY